MNTEDKVTYLGVKIGELKTRLNLLEQPGLSPVELGMRITDLEFKAKRRADQVAELKQGLDDANKRTSNQHYALEKRFNAQKQALHKEGLCSLKNEERLDTLKNETAEWIDTLQSEDARLSARLDELEEKIVCK